MQSIGSQYVDEALILCLLLHNVPFHSKRADIIVFDMPPINYQHMVRTVAFHRYLQYSIAVAS